MDRTELAHFLRTARERVTPADVGLAAGHTRRTPGLRREEVARLAAISPDTYTRLEQARGAQPSIPVLEGVARALRLSADERAHLFHLTGYPTAPGGSPSHVLAPTLLTMLERMDNTAAYILDAAGFVLAWNPLAAALVADFSRWPPADRNLTYQVLCGSEGASSDYSNAEWEAFARECVADLRAAAGRYPNDPAIAALVARLHRESPVFSRWWDEHHVRHRRGGSKRMRHPAVGELELDFHLLLVPDHDQRIVMYSAAPGSPSADAMRLLAVLGTQRVATS